MHNISRICTFTTLAARHSFIVINMPFCPEDVEKGDIAHCTPVFPIVSLWESSWHHCACWLYSVCTKHRMPGLFTLPHVLSFAPHSSHCSAVTCAQNDVMGMCLWQLHLTCFIFVQATVTRKAVRVNTSSQLRLFTTDPAFTGAILGSMWEQEVNLLTGQFRLVTIKISVLPADTGLFNCRVRIHCYQMSGLNNFSPFILG